MKAFHIIRLAAFSTAQNIFAFAISNECIFYNFIFRLPLILYDVRLCLIVNVGMRVHVCVCVSVLE